MKARPDALSTLKCELEFLNRGGYRTPIGRRQPLFCMETGADWKNPIFIEDSPSCPKEKYCACNPEGDCVLMSLVPAEQRHETLPCHHIPLNEHGETIATLEKSGDRKKVEVALKSWLEKNIERLESEAHTTA
jgi:hypothetical protein